ncbi:hypothetical protein EAF04_004787 [Stromatinia cepivora]|nr:hypothetical protein EAF04_004787 [Stromatinia cepivora]
MSKDYTDNFVIERRVEGGATADTSISPSNSTPPTPPLYQPTGSESPVSSTALESSIEDLKNTSLFTDNSGSYHNSNLSLARIQKVWTYIDSWAKGKLDFNELEHVQEFDLTSTEYQHLMKKIDENSQLSSFLIDKIPFAFSEGAQKLRIKMTHPAHQSPIADLLIDTTKALQNRFAAYPMLNSELTVLFNTPFTFFSNRQYKLYSQQKKKRKNFKTHIDTLARTQRPLSAKAVARGNKTIDLLYNEQERPKGDTRLPDLYIFFSSMRYPTVCFEIAWSQGTEKAIDIAAVYLRRSRFAVKIVIIVDMHYDRTKKKQIDPDKTTWVRVFKLIPYTTRAGQHCNKVANTSNMQIRDYFGNFVSNTAANCVEELYSDLLPIRLIEEHSIDSDLLQDKFIITSQRMFDIVSKASRLQDQYRRELGRHERSPSHGEDVEET